MASVTIQSSSAASFQLNGNMLGGLQIDNQTGNFQGLAGGASGSVSDAPSLNANIHNNNIVAALNSVYDAASGNEPTGASGSIQARGGGAESGTFQGGAALLTAAGALSGLTTIGASGLSSLDGGINVDDAFVVSAAGVVSAGSIDTGFGNIDNGTSNITTGGIVKIDVVGTDIGAAGAISMGTSASPEGAIYAEATGLVLDAKTGLDVEFHVAGTKVAAIDDDGMDLVAGDAYQIAGASVLNATTLGSAVVASSLTSVDALNAGSITSGFGAIDNGTSNITTGGKMVLDVLGTGIDAVGALTMGAAQQGAIYAEAAGLVLDAKTGLDVEFHVAGTKVAAIDDDGMDLVAGDAYQIAGASVLNATTLGSAVVESSLTTVGALEDGSISSAFGNIDIGSSTLTAGVATLSSMKSTLIGSSGNAVFLSGAVGKALGEAMGTAEMAKVPVFRMQGSDESGVLREYKLHVSGGMLAVQLLA